MSNETEPPKEASQAATGAAPRPASEPAAVSAEDIAEALSAGPEARIAELEGQIADLTGRLLRAHADMDNLRKRTEREKEETAKYAISRFARDLVGVGDNFQRAAGAVPAGATEQNPALKSLLDGVEMTEREFLKVLEANGVKRIDAQGQPFNPHQHQAVMERADPSVATGTVLQVFQAGYMIEDRCLRPAMVVVSTGGPKAGATADNGEAKPAAAPTDAATGAEPDKPATPEPPKA